MKTSLPKTARADLRELVRLSIPLAVVQLGYHLTGVVDTAFAGRIDEVALGATGIGASVFFATSVIGIGIALGLDPLCAQALGASETRRARHILWQGIYTAVGLSLPLSLAVLVVSLNLETFGIVPELAGEVRVYVFARLLSLLPLLLSVTMRSYLQAAHITRPIVWSTVWTNVFNAVANYVLVFGDAGLVKLGLPAVGLESYGIAGLGWASVIASCAQAATLAWALRKTAVGEGHGNYREIDWSIVKSVLRMGTPIGLHLLAEVGVFSAVQVLIGGIGVLATAGHQVAISIASMSFSVCVGIGAATSVQVGRAIGRGDPVSMRRVGLIGVGLGAGFMLVPALLMWTTPSTLARVMTSDPEAIAAAASLLHIAGWFQIVDGVQAVAGGALRGAGITRFTFVAHLVAHWGIGLPVGAFLSFGLGMGAAGLWWGLTAGLAAVAVVLLRKYLSLSRGPVSRVVIA